MNKIKQTLIAARKLIEKPEHWLQGKLSEVKNGELCFCSAGALNFVIPESDEQLYDDVYLYLLTATGMHTLIFFNDNHTHAEVLAAWDKAIELADRLEMTRLLCVYQP